MRDAVSFSLPRRLRAQEKGEGGDGVSPSLMLMPPSRRRSRAVPQFCAQGGDFPEPETRGDTCF
jgi:hypothetical protein